jgi:hypothetical protein
VEGDWENAHLQDKNERESQNSGMKKKYQSDGLLVTVNSPQSSFGLGFQRNLGNPSLIVS